MDLILRDRAFKKAQVIKKPSYACNYGLYGASKNDFQLVLSEDNPLPIGYMLTYGTTEFGGVILDRKANTAEKTITYIGKSFRGQLENSIIAPTGVLTLTGTDFEIISQIINLSVLDYRVLPTGRTNAKTVILPVATNALKAIDLALGAFNEKMILEVSNDGVEITLSPTSETSFDASQVNLIADENRMMPTALHARGNGHTASVYLQSDGTIGNERYYTGFDAVEISEEITADSVYELTALASDKLLALRNIQNASEVDVKNEDADIGDKINVTVQKYGIKATQTVSEKILKIEGKNEEITFNMGG